MKYWPGIRIGHVNALSRSPVEDARKDQAILLSTDCKVIKDLTVCVLLSQEDKVHMYQITDTNLSRVIALVESVNGNEKKEYVLDQGLLCREVKGKLLFVMPKTMRKSLTVVAHDMNGHPAMDRTVANIQ